MNGARKASLEESGAEVAGLIATLHETERRLEELTGGEVDTVSSGSGGPFLLRRAQEELRASEATRQAAILNALPAHIALLDADGVIVSVNDAWRQFATANHLQGPAFAIGINYLTLCDRVRGGNDSEAHTAAEGIRAVLDGAASFSLEYPCHAPAERRWFQMTGAPLSHASGHGVVVMHINITERKLAEIALRESQATMAAAQHIGHFGSWEVELDDENGEPANLLRWSDEMFRIAGYEPGAVEVTNAFFFTRIPPEEHALIREGVAAAIRERKPYSLVHRLIKADGGICFLQELAKIFYDEQTGRAVKIIGTAHDITERIHAEMALRSSEREQRQLAERLELETTRLVEAQAVANVGSWETDLATLAVIWSDETHRIFETTPKTFAPTHAAFLDRVHPEDRAAVDRAFGRSLTHTTPCSLEHRLRLPDGRIKFVEERWRTQFDPQGKATKVFGTCHDITDRRLAEKALRDSNEKFHQLADNISDAFWIRSPDMREVQYVSPAFEKIWGRTVQSLQDNPLAWSQFIFPEDRARVMAAFDALSATGPTLDIEYRIVRPGGEIRWVRVRGAQIRNEADHLLRHIGIVSDITERKQINLALQESERRFKALFEQAAVGVAQADSVTGRFAQVNQRFSDILGWSREELQQLTFAAITHPHDVAFDVEKMRQLKAGIIREYAREKRYLRKDGAEVWVSLTVSAMWAAGETPGLCIAVVQDITARKRLDEHFLQAQKMEALGQFSGGVAHDFNNILATISGYTELARMLLAGNPQVQGHLGSVLQATGRAADLVNQILTFSRQQPQERHVIQLRPVVEESIKLLRATIPSTITFVTEIVPHAPTVLANANQIHQVLMNLGTNAWHAMKDQPGTLGIRLEKWEVDDAQAAEQPRLRPGSYARISVSDTGSGMDATTMRQIFEPFFTTKPVGEGTGLGLAVVHGIMDGHDGAVTVSSQPGAGSTFQLFFPAQAGEAAIGAIEEGPTPRGHGEVVLVVDDEEMIASMIQMALNRLGYAAEFATDPTLALGLIRADPLHYQLVLSDQTMPGMTGLALATRLREIRTELPVIMMTGFSAALTPDRLAAAGVRQVLLKPLTVQALGTAVHAAFALHSPASL